ncbi:MAG TPA: hypothetical protein VG711_05220 [Phycisphaerales bacterium]|nr:hypothetical protein [Phycisphaerales bacterium]
MKCPRCGYDQRGEIDTWTERCPLEGRCAECGLPWTWGELLNPSRSVPRWHVEYCPAKRLLLATIVTFARSHWPWRYWSQLKMHHAIRPMRILAYLLLLLVLLPGALYVPFQAGMAIHQRRNLEQALQDLRNALNKNIVNLQSEVSRINQLPDDEFKSYQLGRVQAQLTPLLTTKAGLTISNGPLTTTAEAVFLPFANSSYSTIGSGSTAVPYPPPVSLWGYPRMIKIAGGFPISVYSSRILFLHAAEKGLSFWVFVFWLMPFSLGLLPITRKRAKVKSNHIARVFAYGAAMILTSALLSLMLGIVHYSISSAFIDRLYSWIPYACLPTLIFCWWWAGISRYLRMPHGFWVALLLFLTCTLAVFAVDFWWHEWFMGGFFET